MNGRLNKFFHEIKQIGNSKSSYNKFYFPNYKAEAFFKALSENTEKIEELVNFLLEKRKEVLDRYDEYFLIILLTFRAFLCIL